MYVFRVLQKVYFLIRMSDSKAPFLLSFFFLMLFFQLHWLDLWILSCGWGMFLFLFFWGGGGGVPPKIHLKM